MPLAPPGNPSLFDILCGLQALPSRLISVERKRLRFFVVLLILSTQEGAGGERAMHTPALSLALILTRWGRGAELLPWNNPVVERKRRVQLVSNGENGAVGNPQYSFDHRAKDLVVMAKERWLECMSKEIASLSGQSRFLGLEGVLTPQKM
jgi:hypothetical protein